MVDIMLHGGILEALSSRQTWAGVLPGGPRPRAQDCVDRGAVGRGARAQPEQPVGLTDTLELSDTLPCDEQRSSQHAVRKSVTGAPRQLPGYSVREFGALGFEVLPSSAL